MRSSFLLFIAATLTICSFSPGCSKNKINLIWSKQVLSEKYDNSDVFFTDPLNGFIVGGDKWSYGFFAATHDGGLSWQTDSLCSWQLQGLSYSPQQKLFAIGYNAYMPVKESPGENWTAAFIGEWQNWQDVCFSDHSNGLLAGGESYQGGLILRIGDNYEILDIDTFPGEVTAIAWPEPEVIHVVGFGLILRSSDGGFNWEINENSPGDFYRSVSFPTPQTGYIVGSGGSILKTVNGGDSWEKLRNGKSFLVSDTRFRSVYFVNENKGYIVGEKGVFWRTTDGGTTWQMIDDFPETDFYSVFAFENEGWIVGEKGAVFHFQD